MMRNNRIAIIHLVLGIFAVAIIARAAQVQVWQGKQWQAMATRQHVAASSIPAPRGLILDASGTPLAESRERVQLSIATPEIRDPKKLARELKRAGVDASWLARLSDPKRKWVQLPKSFMPSEVESVLGMRGVYPTPLGERVYAASGGAQRIIGHATPQGIGLDGIELTLDSLLRGTQGKVSLVKDVRGRRFESPDELSADPLPGHTVTLTINGALQSISDQALGTAVAQMNADGGDILVLDPNSGDILAMASRRKDPRAVSATAIIEPYEPGSTLKPFTAAALLARRKARVDEVIETYNGAYKTFGRTVHDIHLAPRLSLADVIRYSSNVGIVRFAERLTPREQYEALRDFGFGTPTGIPYPMEAPGTLYPPQDWSKQSAASLAMGYEIAVTPLQLALAYASIANGGELLEPSIVKEVRDLDGKVVYSAKRRVVRRVLTPEGSAQMRRLLASVVDSGTATDAELSTFAVGGKSGTARGMSRGRYVAGSYTASFVGLFPAENPQYVILVKVDNPKGTYYGGKTAAPVSKVVLEAAIAARDAAIDRNALRRRRTEPVFASKDSEPKTGVDTPRAREITVAAGSVEEVDADSVRDAGESASVPFIVSLSDRPKKPVVPIRVRPVPDVRGLPVREAVHTLHEQGFRVQLVAGPAGTTAPEAGTPYRTGSLVRLYQQR
ncbi:MAG TPA: penicillin-binding transpeptidase domain-containing protein [Gemmatimonadaceae bacterium]|nr:penicillin-binding transpeptidase domain-containing protein [Gemmatimonadaceae bacterium]